MNMNTAALTLVSKSVTEFSFHCTVANIDMIHAASIVMCNNVTGQNTTINISLDSIDMGYNSDAGNFRFNVVCDNLIQKTNYSAKLIVQGNFYIQECFHFRTYKAYSALAIPFKIKY